MNGALCFLSRIFQQINQHCSYSLKYDFYETFFQGFVDFHQLLHEKFTGFSKIYTRKLSLFFK
jgi:hypothetical protein